MASSLRRSSSFRRSNHVWLRGRQVPIRLPPRIAMLVPGSDRGASWGRHIAPFTSKLSHSNSSGSRVCGVSAWTCMRLHAHGTGDGDPVVQPVAARWAMAAMMVKTAWSSGETGLVRHAPAALWRVDVDPAWKLAASLQRVAKCEEGDLNPHGCLAH